MVGEGTLRPVLPRDATARYFDEHRPEYSLGRLRFAADWMAEHLDRDISLVDVGCGTGNVLEFLQRRTGITDVTGVDPSPGLAEQTARRLGCSVVVASALDDGLAGGLGRRFDVAIMAAVLHHLVGRTRRASRRLARQGLANSLSVLEPGGRLILFEPIFEPSGPMTVLFWVKRIVSAVYPRRMEVLGRWNNLGAPVVSYLTERELREMVARVGGEVEAEHLDERPVSRLWRACGIRRRADVTLVIRRIAPTL